MRSLKEKSRGIRDDKVAEAKARVSRLKGRAYREVKDPMNVVNTAMFARGLMRQ